MGEHSFQRPASGGRRPPVSSTGVFRPRLAGLLLLSLAAAPARAEQMQVDPATYGDVVVTPVHLEKEGRGDSSSHGYFEYAFRLTNLSDDQPHAVTLSLPDQKYFFRDDAIRELRRTVHVGPRETVRVALLQPDYPFVGGRDVAVIIDGRRQEPPLRLNPNNTQIINRAYTYGGRTTGMSTSLLDPLLLLGPGAERFSALLAPSTGMMGSPGMPAAPVGVPASTPARVSRPPGEAPAVTAPPVLELLPCLGSLPEDVLGGASPAGRGHLKVHFARAGPPEAWSEDWLAYSRFDGIVVGGDGLRALPPGARSALWRYVETGGTLLVLGKADLGGLAAVTDAEDAHGWREVSAGFGRVFVSPDDDFDHWDQARLKKLNDTWRESVQAWQGGQRNTYKANEDFPVVDDLGVPIKGLFVLMFLFALAIGPVNVLLLARKERRVWLLWTTPAISLATCLAVLGYMLLSEGWQGHLRTEAVTLLDEEAHRATTLGWTAVYSPLTPGDGLHFDYGTEVISQRLYEGRQAGARACVIDWSRDQHFASGWVEARVPSHFKLRKSEARRERVTVDRKSDGRRYMVNGLSAPVRRFWFADESGRLHSAEDVAPGDPAELRPTDRETTARRAVNMRGLFFGSNWVTGMQELAGSPERYLWPGSYLAEVDGSPFVENALPEAKVRKCRALVVGFRGR